MIQLINMPNLLSFSRIVVTVVIIGWGAKLAPITISCLVVFAVVSDLLDGLLARLLKCQSALGAQLDPICDAVFVLGLIYYVLSKEQCSLIYLLALAIRYAVISIYHYDLYLRGHKNLASLWSGKWSSGLAMGYLVYYFLYQNGVRFNWTDHVFSLVLVAAGLMQVISWYLYYRRYLALTHDKLVLSHVTRSEDQGYQ